MIPTIEDIIAGLITGLYSAEQAEAWINRHIELATDEVAQRDYFAAKAMQGYVSGHIAHHGHESYWAPRDIAAEAYAMADAMLAARSA